MKKYYSDITGSDPLHVLDSLIRQIQADNHLSPSNGWNYKIEARYKNGKKMKTPILLKRGGNFIITIWKGTVFFDNYYQNKTQYRRYNSFIKEYEVAGAIFKSGNGKGWKGWAEVEHNQFEE